MGSPNARMANTRHYGVQALSLRLKSWRELLADQTCITIAHQVGNFIWPRKDNILRPHFRPTEHLVREA
jgi:hypothetical protein